MTVRACVFWASASAAGWVLGGYPAALALRPARPWRRGTELPAVTMLVPACRERTLLGPKLAALAELDYPAELVSVVVVCDGDPELEPIAREACPQATVLVLGERRGKPSALNLGLDSAQGEVVVLTDAHTPLHPCSVRAAVAHFADPEVAGVSGRWGETGSTYDLYEHHVRRLESRSGSTAGVFGGFFAVRRDRIPPWPTDVVNDDMWLLCRLVRDGGRVVYEPRAAAREPELPAGRQLERRSRIAAGRTMLLGELRGLPPGFALRLVSHKVGRLALPFLVLGSLVSSAMLADRRPYRRLAALQAGALAVGALAAAGVVPPPPARRPARAAGQFVLGNVATARGVLRALRGRQGVRWDGVR